MIHIVYYHTIFALAFCKRVSKVSKVHKVSKERGVRFPESGVQRTEDGGLKTGVHTGRKTEEAEGQEWRESGARVAREWLIIEKPTPDPSLKGREGGDEANRTNETNKTNKQNGRNNSTEVNNIINH